MNFKSFAKPQPATPVQQEEQKVVWPAPVVRKAVEITSGIFQPTVPAKIDKDYIYSGPIEGFSLGHLCEACGNPFAVHSSDHALCPTLRMKTVD